MARSGVINNHLMTFITVPLLAAAAVHGLLRSVINCADDNRHLLAQGRRERERERERGASNDLLP